eukprot:TRINITY_DN16571_c0_g1_i1.p2 TRINITY_DN16571_c0_g1~~TRINITY_DN16571_c0_g1_i1.p2  ORF type:complete len:612 (+),score=212.31 TRINITY_DN16571_c0_g1_i1:114-1949(+)
MGPNQQQPLPGEAGEDRMEARMETYMAGEGAAEEDEEYEDIYVDEAELAALNTAQSDDNELESLDEALETLGCHVDFFVDFFAPTTDWHRLLVKKVQYHTTRSILRQRVMKRREALAEMSECVALCEDLGPHARALAYFEMAKVLIWASDYEDTNEKAMLYFKDATAYLEDSSVLLLHHSLETRQGKVPRSAVADPSRRTPLKSWMPLAKAIETVPFKSQAVKAEKPATLKGMFSSPTLRSSIQRPSQTGSPRGGDSKRVWRKARNSLALSLAVIQRRKQSAGGGAVTSPKAGTPAASSSSPKLPFNDNASAPDREPSEEVPQPPTSPSIFIDDTNVRPPESPHAPVQTRSSFAASPRKNKLGALSAVMGRMMSIASSIPAPLSDHAVAQMAKTKDKSTAALRKLWGCLWSKQDPAARDDFLVEQLLLVREYLAEVYNRQMREAPRNTALWSHYALKAKKTRADCIDQQAALRPPGSDGVSLDLARQCKQQGDLLLYLKEFDAAKVAYERAAKYQHGATLPRGVQFLLGTKLHDAMEDHRIEMAAIRIQAMFRSWQDRKYVEILKLERQYERDLPPFEVAMRRRVLAFCRQCGVRQGGTYCAGCGIRLSNR